MATRPPKRVSATSGQGVSRKSYQTAYSLGQHGGGGSGASKGPPMLITRATAATGGGGVASGKREYGKGGKASSPMNIAYSEREMATESLDALKKVGAQKAPKGGLPKPGKGFF